MTAREKRVGGALLGAVVLLGGYRFVQSTIVEPRARLISDIRAARAGQDNYQNEIDTLKRSVDPAWTKHTRRTLAADPKAAQDAFRQQLSELIDKCGLAAGHKLSQGQPDHEPNKTSPRHGFVELPLSLSVEGRLEQIVDFLRKVYSLPYYARVNRISLSPMAGEVALTKKASGKNAGPTDPQMRLELGLSTVVLPKTPGFQFVTYDPASADAAPKFKQRQADPSEYDFIAKVNWFKVYTPPRETPVVHATTQKPEPPPPPQPAPPVRPNADKMTLVCTESMQGEPLAHVIDGSQALKPLVSFKLNDKIDDGTLELVYHYGMVVRVPEKNDPTAAKHYFYPLGKTFKEREEIAPETNPDHVEVAELLREIAAQ